MKKFILSLALVFASLNGSAYAYENAAPVVKLRIISTTWCGWCHVVADALTKANYIHKSDNDALLVGAIPVKVKGEDVSVTVEQVEIDHKDFSKLTFEPALENNAKFYPFFQVYVDGKMVFAESRSKLGTVNESPDCSTAEGIKARLEMELNK